METGQRVSHSTGMQQDSVKYITELQEDRSLDIAQECKRREAKTQKITAIVWRIEYKCSTRKNRRKGTPQELQQD
jgi:hypothetical protein